MNIILEQLSNPFYPEKLHWRVGSTTKDKKKGMMLAYLDARDVQDRLDAVCGDQWQCRYPLADSGLLICEIGIKFGSDWVWRANGAGDTQVEAEKGKCSDAFKRAAVMWGIGRYLYGIDAPWCELDEYRKPKNFKAPTMPEWATPNPELDSIVRALLPSVNAIKEGIQINNLASAQEAWQELSEEEKRYLWRAPSKGGIFTTEERQIMQSPEFRTANGGS